MPLEINYDNLIIGSSLEAILFCYYNKYTLLYTRNLQPSNIEKIEDFGLGISKKQIWDDHMFLLSIAGYIPFENKIKHIRYISKNNIVVISNDDLVYNVTYNKLYLFDDYNFLDLPITTLSTSEDCRVIDLFSNKFKFSNIENIDREEKIINQIIFDKKTVSVVSLVKKQDIEKYPEHLIKIKTESLLKIPKINLDHNSRQIIDLGQNLYEDFDNVKFMYGDSKLIYDFYKKRSKIDYLKYLKLKMRL